MNDGKEDSPFINLRRGANRLHKSYHFQTVGEAGCVSIHSWGLSSRTTSQEAHNQETSYLVLNEELYENAHVNCEMLNISENSQLQERQNAYKYFSIKERDYIQKQFIEIHQTH